MVYNKYARKIFEVLFPFTDSKPKKHRLALAVSEPDEYGNIDFLLILDIKLSSEITKILDNLLQDELAQLVKIFRLHKSVIVKEIAEVSEINFEKVLKAIVIENVKRYYQFVHKPRQEKKFIPRESRIGYSGRVYDEKEMESLIDSSLEFYLTAGRYDKKFCEKLRQFLKVENNPRINVLTVNSGSSANLIALSALTSPKLKDLALNEGDEVVTVAAGFPTSIAPIIQNKLVPVFVDVELGTYNIDASQVEKAISDKTKAIMIAHTLGIPFDLDGILAIAEKCGLWVIEDNCDALGAEYTLEREYNLIKGRKISGTAKTGTIGHIGTSSFYPAHQITMGEGGAVYTYDYDLSRIALSLRNWGRDCWCDPGRDNTCGKRFEWELGLLPKGYDHKYIYSHVGYNLKITDMQAAIGLAQLEKLPGFVEARYKNWKRLNEGLKDLKNAFILPKHPKNAKPSPFGFALTIKENNFFARKDITGFLEKQNIQTRTVFAGNMLRQPALTDANIKLRIANSGILYSNELTDNDMKHLPNTETVMSRTFWMGVYPGLKAEMLDFMIEKIREFVNKV